MGGGWSPLLLRHGCSGALGRILFAKWPHFVQTIILSSPAHCIICKFRSADLLLPYPIPLPTVSVVLFVC